MHLINVKTFIYSHPNFLTNYLYRYPTPCFILWYASIGQNDVICASDRTTFITEFPYATTSEEMTQ